MTRPPREPPIKIPTAVQYPKHDFVRRWVLQWLIRHDEDGPLGPPWMLECPEAGAATIASFLHGGDAYVSPETVVLCWNGFMSHLLPPAREDVVAVLEAHSPPGFADVPWVGESRRRFLVYRLTARDLISWRNRVRGTTPEMIRRKLLQAARRDPVTVVDDHEVPLTPELLRAIEAERLPLDLRLGIGKKRGPR